MRSARISDVDSIVRAPRAPTKVLHITSRTSNKCGHQCQVWTNTSPKRVIYLSKQQKVGCVAGSHGIESVRSDNKTELYHLNVMHPSRIST